MSKINIGTEFASCEGGAQAYRSDARIDFSRLGKLTGNTYIESFNAGLRAECPNAHIFEPLEDAPEFLHLCRGDYDAEARRSSLDMVTPGEFAGLGWMKLGRNARILGS